jgi:hypothetical protein
LRQTTEKKSVKSLFVIVALIALPVVGATTPAPAQTSSTAPYAAPSEPSLPAQRRVRPRIEVNPQRLLYRRCVDWYELQHRPSGTVLFPQMHCWWVRG